MLDQHTQQCTYMHNVLCKLLFFWRGGGGLSLRLVPLMFERTLEREVLRTSLVE